MPQPRGTSTRVFDQSHLNMSQVGHDNVFHVKADIAFYFCNQHAFTMYCLDSSILLTSQ